MPHKKLWFTRKEFCEKNGLSKQRLYKIIKAGHIQKKHMDKRGTGRHKLRIKMKEALQDISNNLIRKNRSVKDRMVLPPHEKNVRDNQEVYKDDSGAAVSVCGFSRLTSAEARLEHDRQKAAKLKMENDKVLGELISLGEVTKQAFDSARLTRDAILSVPDRMAAELASITDVHEINDRLTRELTQALEDLAEALT
ncbi:MAG: hypothetical protein GY941_23770 [Planctomycetes bacterium]|nr:hypothetical protein [Planctomycetota bacterium]